jgi:hypothetical protein
MTALAALALTACGGGSTGCNGAFAGSNCTSAAPKVASVLLVSNTNAIPSDNSAGATLTAYVRDATNNFIKGVPVLFTVDTGGINVTQGTTDANGVATASLNTLGDKTNRTITITANASGVIQTAKVQVIGTKIDLQGPVALTAGQQGTYTAKLTDAGGNPITSTAITVTAPANVTVSGTSLTTDASTGIATFTGTGATSGTGSLQVAGLGLTKSISVTVNGDSLAFTAPTSAVGLAIPLNTAQAFTVHWASNGVAQANQPITFATTRGCVNPAGTTCVGQPITATVTTNGSGDATVQLLSDNAGGASVSATTNTGTSAQFAAGFIATVGASIDVQPSLFTVGTGQTSTITAVVRDANNNLVTNATVVFSLNDITGGTLSLASALTNSEGRASTVYTAGSVTSAQGGVHVTAALAVSPSISKTVLLTVAQRQVFISIGTGNEITEPNSAQYQIDYIVQVTDANGAGVSGVNLGMSVLSQRYFKGHRTAGSSTWSTCYTIPQALASCIVGTPPDASVTLGCADEDFNRNGILDPGENKNGNNPATVSAQFPTGYATLEAGNIALVSPNNAVTDANGFVLVHVFYPQEYAYYLQVTLQAQTNVQGTAFSAMSTFLLPGSATDFNSLTVAPPGVNSPFGTSATCSDQL